MHLKYINFQVTAELTGHIKEWHFTRKTFLNSDLEEVQHWNSRHFFLKRNPNFVEPLLEKLTTVIVFPHTLWVWKS